MLEILLISADDAYARRIAHYMQGLGMEMKRTVCVISALEEARLCKPDIILCSEFLPGLDALDLLQIRREASDLSNIPVLVMSESNRRKLDFLREGCDDFLQLPLDEGELELRVKAVVRRINAGGLRGDFAHINLLELIQMLTSARRDGILDVDCGEVSGQIFFRQGQAFHALSRGLEGEDAFLSILRAAQKGGSFVFESAVLQETTQTIEKRTDHLLLGLANALDEEEMAA